MYAYKISLSEKEYIQFNEYHLLHSAVGKKALLQHKIVLPLLSLLIIIIFFSAKADMNLIIIESIFLGICSIMWIIYSKKIVMKSFKKNIEKIKKEGRLPFESETTVTFDDQGIIEKSSNAETKTSYSVVEKIAETKQAIYIYMSAVQAIIIPTSYFDSEEDKDELIKFIETKREKAI